MSSRIFQSVVLQMKDSTDRAIGVIDSEGTVVACNELSLHWRALARRGGADQPGGERRGALRGAHLQGPDRLGLPV